MKLSSLVSTALAGLSVVTGAQVVHPAGAHAASEFRMGLVDPIIQSNPTDPTMLARLRDSAASVFRVNIQWSQVATNGNDKPAGFDTRDPGDSHYDFSKVDPVVKTLAQNGIDPVLTIYSAPNWAEGNSASDRRHRKGDAGTYNPNPGELGDFAHALATRYSGNFKDPADPSTNLPRVRFFQVWNEENFGQYLSSTSRARIPVQYVLMLNSFYDQAKAVDSTNQIITGGLGPYGFNGHATDYDPQLFMRAMFCLSGKAGKHLRRHSCQTPKAKFDAFAVHPYTLTGTPTSKGVSPDAGAMGNMPEVRATLDAASRFRRVVPAGRKPLWVTEFGFFTNPPGLRDGEGRQLGKPPAVQARYLSQTAYLLWRLKVGTFLWYAIRDYDTWPGGLYFAAPKEEDDKPKPSLSAYKFPFYTYRSHGRVAVWGLVDGGGQTNVAIERLSGGKFVRVATVRSNSGGLVNKRLPVRTGGTYRGVALDGAKQGLVSYSYPVR